MYTEIGLEELFGIVKELFESSPDAWVSVTVGTNTENCQVKGGMIDFVHNKAKSIQKGDDQRDPNPRLRALWKSHEFRDFCRTRGIEPELCDDRL